MHEGIIYGTLRTSTFISLSIINQRNQLNFYAGCGPKKRGCTKHQPYGKCYCRAYLVMLISVTVVSSHGLRRIQPSNWLHHNPKFDASAFSSPKSWNRGKLPDLILFWL